MKIKIDGENYNLNYEEAKRLGVLVLEKPIGNGDVFVCKKKRTNPLLLVECLYSPLMSPNEKRFQLLGIGLSPNSDSFYHDLHTEEEIKSYLKDKGMVFSKNIGCEVEELVR